MSPDNVSEREQLILERDSCKRLLSDINAKYLEKIEELSLIRRVSDALKDITDFASVCTSIVAIIQQELDPDNCSLIIVDEEKGELAVLAAKGPYDKEARFFTDTTHAPRFRMGESIAGHVARSGTSIRIVDTATEKRFIPRSDSDSSIRSLLCIPLTAGERVIAVLNLSHKSPGAFNADTERILSIIANSSAVTLENTRLYEKLRRSRDKLAQENIDLKNELMKKFSRKNIIGTSAGFTAILKRVEKVAGVRVNVLVTGESGTGKEMIARALHYTSPCARGPFVAVNCAALPENLLESELFGIERGVATGVEKRTGKFELASGGTIFLDEVGDMSLQTQAKILRVLQEQEVQPVGSSSPRKIDVRVVSATNKNLEDEIIHGNFREDLYYRLKVVAIQVPPLRGRREDIPLLANYFLKTFCTQHKVGEKWFSRAALDLMTGSRWRGNVRELKNVVEQAAILSSGEIIGPDDLALPCDADPSEMTLLIPENRMNFKATLRELTAKAEADLIRKALQQSGNNKSRAARLLGISRRTLLYKLGRL